MEGHQEYAAISATGAQRADRHCCMLLYEILDLEKGLRSVKTSDLKSIGIVG